MICACRRKSLAWMTGKIFTAACACREGERGAIAGAYASARHIWVQMTVCDPDFANFSMPPGRVTAKNDHRPDARRDLPGG